MGDGVSQRSGGDDGLHLSTKGVTEGFRGKMMVGAFAFAFAS